MSPTLLRKLSIIVPACAFTGLAAIYAASESTQDTALSELMPSKAHMEHVPDLRPQQRTLMEHGDGEAATLLGCDAPQPDDLVKALEIPIQEQQQPATGTPAVPGGGTPAAGTPTGGGTPSDPRSTNSAGSVQALITNVGRLENDAAISGVSARPGPALNQRDLSRIRETLQFSEMARGNELVRSALLRKTEIENTARSDGDFLTKQYEKIPLSQAGAVLKRAKDYLEETAKQVENSSEGLLPPEIARFRNLYMNASDKANAAESLLDEYAQKQPVETLKLPFNPFDLPIGQRKTPELNDLSQLLGPSTSGDAFAPPTSEDGLINRMIMFGGLDKPAQKEAQKSLGLVYYPKVKLAGGATAEIPLLHNGYILGANSKTALDCSSFISEMLSASGRKMRLTTLDFLQIWRFQKTNRFPKPPTYDKTREAWVKDISKSFVPIDIYSGDRLATGDFLVYRKPEDPLGHIVLIKKYDPSREMITMLDASQTAGTIRERELKLGYRDSTGKRYLRSGFIALRMKASNSTTCQYKR
jgi:hypothetical protein